MNSLYLNLIKPNLDNDKNFLFEDDGSSITYKDFIAFASKVSHKLTKLGLNTGDIISVKNPEAILRGKSDKYGYDISGEVGVSVGLPDGATLETTGSATFSGVPNETNYELRVEDVGIDLKFGDKLHASASNVNYDKSNKTLSAS